MKYGEATMGQFEAVINRLGGMNGLKKFLSGELVLKAVELLAHETEVSVPAIKSFVAAKAFVLDTSATAKVKIGYLGENFKANFLNTVEKNIPVDTLVIHRLIKNSLDQPILDQLGDKAYTSLAHLYYLLSQQPNGEAGPLLTNGYCNIFYIRGKDSNIWAVDAYWYAGLGWHVYAHSVDDPGGWDADDRVFSRK